MEAQAASRCVSGLHHCNAKIEFVFNHVKLKVYPMMLINLSTWTTMFKVFLRTHHVFGVEKSNLGGFS